MNLIRFEIKKFFLNKKNLILFAVFSSLLLGGRLQQEFQANNLKNNHQAAIQMVNQKIDACRKVQSFADENKLSQEERQRLQEDINIEQMKLTALQKNDINEYFNLRYESDRRDLEDMESRNPNIIFGPNQKEETETEMRYIELVKSRGLDFEYQPGSQIYAFGKLVSGLTQIFSNLWLLGFAIILSVSLASIFESKEERIYHSLSIKKFNILGSKLLSSVGVTYIWLWVLSLVFFIMFGVINGFGSPNYPAYLVNLPSLEQLQAGMGNVKITVANMAIGNGQVILLSLLYAVIVLFFLATIGMFFSILTKRSLVVVAIIAILIMGYESVKDKPWIQSIRKFIPMSYTNPIELLKYPEYLFGKNSLLVGALYLSGLTLLLLFFTNLTFKNYRIRRI
jgi:ABC-2 type transport system permease protein